VSLPAADRNRFAQRLFTPLPARYDRLAEILSMGQNGRWRHEMVDHIVSAVRPAPASAQAAAPAQDPAPARGTMVLDVASGTAGVAIQLASRTGARVVGIDLTEEMLRQGRANVTAAGLDARVGLVAGRAERLPFPDASFDALTFTYLLRYVDDPQATLAELARVVKPGGMMASLEFCVPPLAFWRSAWVLYTRLVLPAGGLVLGGPAWLRVGQFLGPNITSHYRRYPVAWTVEAWHRAGFGDVGARIMSLGGGLVMWGTRISG
jgi:demethylmenaquinone methyltransferase/2-methoxy-6-polyprenyl-1,4-benzoquinol methylase